MIDPEREEDFCPDCGADLECWLMDIRAAAEADGYRRGVEDCRLIAKLQTITKTPSRLPDGCSGAEASAYVLACDEIREACSALLAEKEADK